MHWEKKRFDVNAATARQTFQELEGRDGRDRRLTLVASNSTSEAPAKAAVLNSWKEIAAFLERGVRTVQRWERTLQLPVHRIGRGKRSPVYAVASELKFWMLTSTGARVLSEDSDLPANPVPYRSGKRGAQLVARLHELAQAVAENSVRHQRQAQELQKRITALQSQVRSRPEKS